MNEEVYACHEVKDSEYKCKVFKDFIGLNDYYKQSNKSLIIIPTKYKLNYDRNDLLKDEITKHIIGNLNKNNFINRLTKNTLNINID